MPCRAAGGSGWRRRAADDPGALRLRAVGTGGLWTSPGVLPGELGVQARDTRVHVRRREAPPLNVRDEGLVERERDVAVRQVVEVHAERQTRAGEADDLLHTEIPLPDPLS